MQTDVRLNAFRERFQDAVHVDSFGVLPLVIERFLHLLGQGFADAMMFDEVINALLHLLQFFGALVQFDDDGRHAAENRRTEKGCRRMMKQTIVAHAVYR